MSRCGVVIYELDLFPRYPCCCSVRSVSVMCAFVCVLTFSLSDLALALPCALQCNGGHRAVRLTFLWVISSLNKPRNFKAVG
jgi:hypothetical protein